MKTDQLIDAIASDTEREQPVSKLLPVTLLIAGVIVGLIFLLIVGQRADPEVALTEWNVMIKQLFPVILALGGFGAVLRLARPGASTGGWVIVIAAVPLILAAAVIADLMILPRAEWQAAMMGKTRWFCLAAIPLMSLPILGGSLWALGRGASTRPALTGAAAGLMSAGTATALYAIHCIEDSPLFYGTWYVIGILAVTALGALIGPRFLRW